MSDFTVRFPDGSTLPFTVTQKTGPAPPTNALHPHSVTFGTDPRTQATVTLTPGKVVPPSQTTPVPVGALLFVEDFSDPALPQWSKHWFLEGGSMNNVGTYAANVRVAGGVCTLKLAGPDSGALISTNPNGGAAKGFQFGVNVYVEFEALFDGIAWEAVWTDGQSWPADGETDIAEWLGSMTSNYHSPQGANNGPEPGPSGFTGGWHRFGYARYLDSNSVFWDGRLQRTYLTDDGGALQYLVANTGSGTVGAELKVRSVKVWALA